MADAVEHLIDISVYNSVNDWNAVRADGIVGASIKVSQQVNYLNPSCGAQVAGARAAGVAPGGYHFGDPRVNAAQQAQFFVNNARQFGLFDDGALAPMYDAENWEGGGLVWPSPQVLNSHIAEHIRVVRQETGVARHLVYGSLSWWQSRWIDPDVWADEDVLLWVAVYNGQPGYLQGWSHPNDALHQHTSDGIVSGIPGRVDKNVTLRGRRIGDLVNGGNDMQLSDRMLNAWGGTPTMEEVFRYIDLRSTEAAQAAAAANAKLDALLGRDVGTFAEADLAQELLTQSLSGKLDTLPDDQFDALVKAVAADQERRARTRSA
ncbi:glycoside hydrolase family 25 protein [Umezawaea sp. Da 62-37]|uniref:glycoside hydrolase family 25 protein n=1 Tax=Umezawaea sp. Da 62-37 TaxID=3075927 RepID=UPI0028F6EAF6|nr:glycoside hydrolase family 25 protein [Umezawaea sp. Da 62-37]WNV88342.1 glycoside hydrolase family 25 protein [Umezawaea sp. Da 62-37]